MGQKTKGYCISVSGDLHDRLRARCERDGISMRQRVEILLDQVLPPKESRS